MFATISFFKNHICFNLKKKLRKQKYYNKNILSKFLYTLKKKYVYGKLQFFATIKNVCQQQF